MIFRSVNYPLSNASTTLWSWLFPITYLLHIVEEYWGGEGYSAYLMRMRGIQLSPGWFLVVQAIGLTLVIVGIILARRLRFPNLLSVILGSVVLLNGLTHTILSLAHTQYVPGLITSVLLWIPLGITTLLVFKRTMGEARYWLCVAFGVAINGIIELVTSQAVHAF
jgi:uncharacterized membrane protein HdeD (DUF308 family)